MEKHIRKRASLYGITAVLLALILAVLCFDVGVYQPELKPPVESSPTIPATLFKTFSSYEDLRDFLEERSGTQEFFPYYGSWSRFLGSPSMNLADAYTEASDSGFEHSTTNIQVAGVDEADIVKTDKGGCIYLVSGNDVFILKAYPPIEAEVLSKISLNETDPIGIFVNGDRLAVLGCKYVDPYRGYYPSFYEDSKTFINIYDISNRTDPSLVSNFTISGTYFNSRMIGEYVYFVLAQPAQTYNATVVLPEIYSQEGTKQIGASEIQYFDTSDSYYVFTTIVVINIQDVSEEPTQKTILIGGTSCMYVSLDNIYLTFPKSANTVVYRIQIEDGDIKPAASCEVPGYVLNQFSMDEYNGYFRIATTTGHVARILDQATSENHVYVLNMNLDFVGKLENLAAGEKIYSARFMGDRCYLVTFKKIDPLFVIDLTEPTKPTVLGELKIPGYSDYLHPYDEDHIIGVGKETVEAAEGDFAWYQGVKISLFDVSDTSNPIQVSKYIIGDRGTDSPILRDHKAFLFDKSKDLLVIPVFIHEIDETRYPEGVPSNAYGTPVWQGAYIFNITLSNGFTLEGNVTHMEDATGIWDISYWVKRSLYVENMLYTVSDKKIEINSLKDLAPVGEIKLS